MTTTCLAVNSESEVCMNYCHEHPVIIFKYAYKNIWLLVFPLLRAIRTAHLDIDFLYHWLKGTWFDILIILLIILFGYINWACSWFKFIESDDEKKGQFIMINGIFYKKYSSIPINNITAVTKEHLAFLRPFKAVRVSIDTRGGKFNHSDIKLIMKRNDINEFLENTLPTDRRSTMKIKTKWYDILLFSFVFSSSLSGAIYFSAIFFQLGKVNKSLVENELKNVLDKITSEVISRFAHGVTPAAVTVGLVILFSWLISFILNLFKYSNFRMIKKSNFIKIDMGFISKRRFHIAENKINYIDLCESLIMRIFKRTSFHISCSGYGKQKNELPVLIPVMTRSQCTLLLKELNFSQKIYKYKFNSRKSFITFTWIPLVSVLLIAVVGLVIIYVFPDSKEFVLHFLVLFEVPLIWLFIIKLISMFSTRIIIDDNFIMLKYSKKYIFHTVMADRGKLVQIKIVQTPIQKITKKCRIDFYFNSEITRKNKIKGISMSDAYKIAKILKMD